MSHVKDLWHRLDPETKKKVRTARYGIGRRWQARWIDPQGRERSKLYATKDEAEAALANTTVNIAQGAYVDPRAGKVTVKAFSLRWLATKQSRTPKTYAGYESLLRRLIWPRWEHVELAKVDHLEVVSWVAWLTAPKPAGRGLSASQARQAHQVFVQVLDLAVKGKRIAANPARGVPLPTLPESRRRYLTHAEVAALADAAGPHRLLVLVLAYTGLRWGEVAGLQVGDVALLRKRLHVHRAVSDVDGRIYTGAPKGHRQRWVALLPSLAKELGEAVAGRDRTAPLFPTPTGKVWRYRNFRRDVFDKAAAKAGFAGLTPHELRHTAASLAVSDGANPLAVARMLGHRDPSVTLRIYADLFDRDLEDVAKRLDKSARKAETEHRRNMDKINVVPIKRARR